MSASAIERLLAQPQGFEFFQAVRLLRRWLGGPDAAGLPRLRFRNSLSLGFPAAEIESLALSQPGVTVEDRAVALTPSFFGLLGAQGALPHHYTELVAQRELLDRDPSARAFLDLFTDRAAALFHAAWQKHRPHLQDGPGAAQGLLPLLLALAGLGPPALRGRLDAQAGGVADEAVAYFAGAVQGQGRSAAQVERLLAGYLGVPVRIQSFAGRWYALPPRAAALLGRHGSLGSDAVLGERVWQRDLAVRVELGPLDAQRFRRFLPGGAGERALRRWFVLLTGASLDVEVRLRLRREAVQGLRLAAGADTPAVRGRLGWDTFLCTELQARDRDDVCYDLPLTPPADRPATAAALPSRPPPSDLEQDRAFDASLPCP